MTYRAPALAPESQIPEPSRGAVGGRFCRGCGSIYPRFAARHVGKPMHGKDHVSAPCSHEGQPFSDEAGWWEPAVEVVPEPVQDSAQAEATGDSA